MSLKVGDKIRILEDRHEGARVFKGDVLEVTEIVNKSTFATDAPRLERIEGDWWFGFDAEGIGWEKYEEAGE